MPLKSNIFDHEGPFFFHVDIIILFILGVQFFLVKGKVAVAPPFLFLSFALFRSLSLAIFSSYAAYMFSEQLYLTERGTLCPYALNFLGK